jgi:hypothetical protein
MLKNKQNRHLRLQRMPAMHALLLFGGSKVSKLKQDQALQSNCS